MGHFWWRAKRVVPFSTTFTMDPERGRRRARGALFAILGRGPLMISPSPPSPSLMLFAVFPGLE